MQRAKLPSYIPLMMGITALYLTVEIPFSVHLIGVMGGNPSQADIDNIEMIGRILTGVAVSIFFLGVLVFPIMRGFHIVTALMVAIACGAGATYGTFHLLDWIASHIGSESSSLERREAFISNIAKRHIGQHGVGDISVNDAGDWNTFASVLPFLANSDQLVQMTGVDIEEMARNEAARMMGTHAQFRHTFFDVSYGAVRKNFAVYQNGVVTRLGKLREVELMAQNSWDKYRSELRRNRMEKSRYSASEASRIREQLSRREGLRMPKSWNPNDRATFLKIVTEEGRKRVEDEFKRRIEKEAGGYIKPGLSFDEFVIHPLVQKNMRANSNLPNGKSQISDTMNDHDFVREVYEPKRAALEEELAQAVMHTHTAFAKGEKFEGFGVNAVKAIQIPIMAIALSIAGAILHIFKISGYITQVFGHMSGIRIFYNAFGRFTTASLVTLSAFGFMFLSGNAVTASNAFQSLDSKSPVAMVLIGAIGIQPEFSTLAKTLELAGPWGLIRNELPVRAAFLNDRPISATAGNGSDTRQSLDGITVIPIPTWRPES